MFLKTNVLCLQKARVLKQKKEEGNAAFKAGKLTDAHKLYSEALEIDPLNKFTNAKLYFNRATVAAKVSLMKFVSSKFTFSNRGHGMEWLRMIAISQPFFGRFG